MSTKHADIGCRTSRAAPRHRLCGEALQKLHVEVFICRVRKLAGSRQVYRLQGSGRNRQVAALHI